MPNRTIYVKDEELWNSAKTLAGKSGLSPLIETLLRTFVSEKAAEPQGFPKQTIDVAWGADRKDEGGSTERVERIAFYGRLLSAREFERAEGPPAVVELYQTKAGKVVLVGIDQEEGAVYYATAAEPLDFESDAFLESCLPSAVREWLDEVRDERLRENASETWID